MNRRPVDTVRSAFEAFLRQDLVVLGELVHPELEWTYLDPTAEEPTPATCHGRHELERAAARWARMGLATTVESLEQCGDKVLVVLHAPGLDGFRARKADDRNFHLVTVSEGRVTAIRACRDATEAETLAGRAIT